VKRKEDGVSLERDLGALETRGSSRSSSAVHAANVASPVKGQTLWVRLLDDARWLARRSGMRDGVVACNE
jgi:hypothetical protein